MSVQLTRSRPKFMPLKDRVEEILRQRGSTMRRFCVDAGFSSKHISRLLPGRVLAGAPVRYYSVCNWAARFGLIPLNIWKMPERLIGSNPTAFRQHLDYNYLRDGYLADVISVERRALGLSQADLGIKSGISPGLISNLETYAYTPATDRIEKICDVLGLKTEWLAEVE